MWLQVINVDSFLPFSKIKSFLNKGNSLSERTHLFNLAKTRGKLLAKLTLCSAPLGSMCKPSQMQGTHAGNKPTPGEDPSWASALLLSLLSSLLPSTRTKIQSSCLGLQYVIPSEGSCHAWPRAGCSAMLCRKLLNECYAMGKAARASARWLQEKKPLSHVFP